jgi:ATP-dependent RNA helicase HelY
LRRRTEAIARRALDLAAIEARHGVGVSRPPDPTFVSLAQAWAAGGTLEDVLVDSELPPGDFVRVIKQLIDLLGQVARMAPVPATAHAARSASGALRRGIVAASSFVGDDDGDEGEGEGDVEESRPVGEATAEGGRC